MILAIDLGSTSFKAAVFDPALNVLGSGSAPLKYKLDAGGVVELEVAHAEERFRNAIRGAIRQGKVRASDIRAIGITSQAQTFTTCQPGGVPKTPFISWLDVRAQDIASRPLPDFGLHCGFNDCLPGLLFSKLAHLHDRAEHRFVRPGDTVFFLPTWFVWKLTGTKAVDCNLAAMSGLYSMVSGEWWPDALARCGIAPGNLPSLIQLGAVAGLTTSAAREWGLPPGIPVVCAGNDQTSGAWGADLQKNKGLLITLGTAQVAYRCLDALPPPAPGCLRGPFGNELFYQLAADDSGCSVVDWAKALFAERTDGPTFFGSAALAPPGCDGLVFNADLGAGRGSWTGIDRHHTRAHFARSVVESLAGRMAGMVRQLGVDPRATPVLVAGGGSRYAFWVEVLGQAIGARVTQTTTSPLLGAARMAHAKQT